MGTLALLIDSVSTLMPQITRYKPKTIKKAPIILHLKIENQSDIEFGNPV